MVRAKYSSKHSGSRNGRSNASSSHESSRMSTRPSSPSGSHDSIDSLDYTQSSHNDRLINSPSKSSDMSTPPRHRLWLYDRLVCEAVARLKRRKGSSIQDIAKNLEHTSNALNLNSSNTQKVITTSTKKLVRQGKLVKQGSNYRLNKKPGTRKGGRGKRLYPKSEDEFQNSRPRRSRSRRGSYSRHSRRHRHHHSRSGSRSRRGRRRGSRSRSTRSSGKRRRSRSLSRSRRRRSPSSSPSRSRRESRSRAVGEEGGSSSRRKSLKRRDKRRKKGARKGQTRLSTGRRGPHQKKIPRARRRAKHSYSRRPKSDKITDGDGSQNKGWFGGWFGGKSGDQKPDGKDKGKADKGKSEKGKSDEGKSDEGKSDEGKSDKGKSDKRPKAGDRSTAGGSGEQGLGN